MESDYGFFRKHAGTWFTFESENVDPLIGGGVEVFFDCDPELVNSHYKILRQPDVSLTDPKELNEFVWLAKAKGACFRGKPQNLEPLEDALHCKLPEDFARFYREFGECLIVTRSKPITVRPIDDIAGDIRMDEDFGEYEEGRFFWFATYQGVSLHFGMRRNEITNEWEVCCNDYGLLYDEMIGPEGRETVIAPSFYDWLRTLVTTNGCPAPGTIGDYYGYQNVVNVEPPEDK